MAHVTVAATGVTARQSSRVLPRPIRKALGRVDRRLRALAAIRGIGTASAVAAVVAAAAMAADFAVGLPQQVRWGVWGLWLAAVAVPLLGALGRVFSARSQDLALAATLERADPSLGERVTGAVDLLEGPVHGSPSLIAALADDAASHVATVSTAAAAPSGRAMRRLLGGLAALAVVAAPTLVRDDPFGRLARRLTMPWVDADRVGLFAVTVTPGDVVMALGDDLRVTATVAPRFPLRMGSFGKSLPDPGAAWLEWDEADGTTRRIAMADAAAASESDSESATQDGSGSHSFSVVLPKVAASLSYRVVSRSGESRKYRVTAAEPPAVKAIVARVEPPSYTKFPAVDIKNPARIDAFEESRVALTVTGTRPVVAGRLSWPGSPPDGASTPSTKPVMMTVDLTPNSEGAIVAKDLPAVMSGDYELRLRDALGLWSRPERPRRLAVRPDKPPVLLVRGPRGEAAEEVRGDDVFRVGMAARDDVAVASVELHYQVERAASSSPGLGEKAVTEEGHSIASPRGLGTAAVAGELALPLKPLGVKPGDVVSWRVRVADNRPAPRGPNVVWSGERRLTIVAKADPLWARRGQVGREEIQKELDALKKATAENRQATEQLRYAADAARNGNGTFDRDRVRELARREETAKDLVDGLHKFASKLDEEPPFRPLARAARQTANVEAEAARATLDQARQDEDPAKRFADLRLADTRLSAVANRLEEIQRDLNAMAERENEVRRLQALADRQAEIAARAGGDEKQDGNPAPPAAPPDRIQLDRLAAEQNAVKNDLEAILRRSPDLRADVLAAEAEKAEQLARKARAVADRQREEARRATDMGRKTNTLRKLAEEQRGIEEDARRLALDVDAALAENGRPRVNVDAIRQAAEPLERGELAQGRERVAGAESELRMRAKDLEEAPRDLKSLAYRLLLRQDQIRNDLNQAIGDARGKDNLPAPEREALAKRLAPIAARQKAVADLAAAVLNSTDAKAPDNVEPRFPRDAAGKAAEATAKAVEADRNAANPREAEARANEARDALNRLTNELPDVGRREAPARQAFNEARQNADQASHQVDQFLRETERPWDQNLTPARAAAELAQKLNGLPERLKAAVDKLNSTPPIPRTRLHNNRASRRTRALAEAVEKAREMGKHDPNGPPPPGFDADHARALRDVLAAAAAESRAGFERLEQKMNGVVAPADEVADELAADERDAAAAADKRPQAADEANTPAARVEDQQRLAAALRALKAPDAPLDQAEAVRLADRAVEALKQEAAAKPAADAKAHSDGKDAREAVRRAADAAAALADRLNDRQSPRDRVQALARAERGLNDPAVAPEPAEDIARQHEVMGALERLPLAKGEAAAAAKAAEAVREAVALAERVRSPEEAAPGQGRPTPKDRAAARARAAEALDALATRLNPGQADAEHHDEAEREKAALAAMPRDSELAIDPAHAVQARELARRERRVREKLMAVLADQVKPQQEVRHEAAEVGHELADLRDRSRDLSPRAAGPANEAAALLGEQAPQAMNDAAGQLAQGQADPAREAQRRAADLAERGAQRADDLAAALRADLAAPEANATNAESKHQPDANAMADARAAMSRASRSLGQARQPQPAQEGNPVADARAQMRAAAERLQAAAEAARSRGQDRSMEHGEGERALAQQQSDTASPTTSMQEPTGQKAGVAEADTLREIQELVRKKTGRKWGELPGHLRSEILQMSQGRYRDDYARLIQLYFREIAAGASSAPSETSADKP